MSDRERLIADVVAVIVEKVLMELGVLSHTKATEMLKDHNLVFSDCYQNPDVLNFILKELFGHAYLIVADKIKNELVGLEDHSPNFVQFIQKIGA